MITNHDLLDNLRGQVYHLQQKLIEAQKDRDDFKLRLEESFAEKHMMWCEIDDLKWRLEGFENNIEQAQKLLSGNKHVGKHILCAAIDEIADLKARLEKTENECSGLLSLLNYERSMRRVERKERDSYEDGRDAAIARADALQERVVELENVAEIDDEAYRGVLKKYDEAIRERDALFASRQMASTVYLDRIARLVGLLNRVAADCLSLTDRQLVEEIQNEIGEMP